MKKSNKAALVTIAGLSSAIVGFTAFCDSVFLYMSDRNTPPLKPLKKDDKQYNRKIIAEHVKPMIDERLELTSDCNNEKRYCFYIKPEVKSDKAVILCHGFKGNHLGDVAQFVDYYKALGYNIFMVDHRASGESEGRFLSYGYFESEDLILWINKIVSILGPECKIILHGVSMGAATVLQTAGKKDLPENVKLVVSDCSYTDAWEESKYIFNKRVHIYEHPALDIINGITENLVGYNIHNADAKTAAGNIQVPVLFIHGEEDKFVPTYMAPELYKACSSKVKKLVTFPGAGHVESYHSDPKRYEKELGEFIESAVN